MIQTNYFKFYATSLFDSSVEIEISEEQFIDLVNFFRKDLQPEWGSTYKKYWMLDSGVKTSHYLVKRLVGIRYEE